MQLQGISELNKFIVDYIGHRMRPGWGVQPLRFTHTAMVEIRFYNQSKNQYQTIAISEEIMHHSKMNALNILANHLNDRSIVAIMPSWEGNFTFYMKQILNTSVIQGRL